MPEQQNGPGFFTLRIVCYTLVLFAVCACGAQDAESGPDADFAMLDSGSILRHYSFQESATREIELPKSLREISGLAMSPDGRLFAHNDEAAFLHQLNPESGVIEKTFGVGDSVKAIKDDFEGLAIVGERFFLVNSAGRIYEFREGTQGEIVACRRYESGLDARYDVEGLCYDPEYNALLLACKGYAGDDLLRVKAVYAFGLDSLKLFRRPRFVLPLQALKLFSREQEFKPSGIEFHPHSGSFLVLAARGNVLVEIGPDGQVAGAVRLPARLHRQPEGIAIREDGLLILANEGSGKKANLVLYAPDGPAPD